MDLWQLSIFICVFGLFGNLFVIFFSLYCVQLRKSTSNWYIFHLAIADTLFLFSIPFTVSQFLNNAWIYADGFCPIQLTALYLNLYASALFLSVLSFDRYILVCRPFSQLKKTLQSRQVSNAVAFVVWIVALCCCIPVLIHSGVNQDTQECTITFPNDNTFYDENVVEGEYDYELGSGGDDYDYNETTTTVYHGNASGDDNWYGDGFFDCTYDLATSGYRRLILFNFALMYALPMMVMGLCYGLLVSRISSGGPVSTTGQQVRFCGRRSAVSKRATVMCAALVSCFALLCLPFQIFHLGKLLGWHVEKHHCINMSEVFNNLIYLNSAINPYLYTFLCTSFRGRLKSFFNSLLNRDAQLRPQQSSNSNAISGTSATKLSRFRRKSSLAGLSVKSKEASAPSSGNEMYEMKSRNTRDETKAP